MLESLLKFVIPLFHSYGFLILLVTSFLESLPLVGAVVPGATIVVFAGFVVRKHALHFWPVVLIVTLGAFIGDATSYVLGRRYGYEFLKKYGKYIFLTEARLEYVRGHIKHHRGKTLILGRFTAVTRSIAPFASGASHVPEAPFFGFTLLSAFMWSLSHVLIGFIFGRWLEKISRYLGYIFFASILVGIAVVYGYRYINQRHHIFKKLHVYTLTCMIFSVFFFSATLQGLMDNDWLFLLDRYVAHFARAIQQPWLTKIMIVITHFGDATYLSLLTITLVLYLVSRKKLYLASLALFSVFLGGTLQFIIKSITNFPRPLHPLIETVFSSFPSGHSTAAVIFGSFVFLAFVDVIKLVWAKYTFFVIILVAVSLVGFSRIYLSAHFTTDVIAGMSLGLFCVTSSILLFRVVIFTKKWLD